MILVVLAVVLATGTGVISEHRFAGVQTVAQRILWTMLYLLVPFVSYVNVAHLSVTVGHGIGLGFGYVSVALAGTLAWALGRFGLRLFGAQLGAVICTVVVVNTGYLGYPMAVALIGAHALPSAVAYDQLVSGPSLFLLGFGVGAAFGTSAGVTARSRASAFLTRNPPLVAVIAGLLVPSSWSPAPLPAISHMVVGALLVLGFFVVGVYLASERREDHATLLDLPDRPVLLAVGMRNVVAPLVLIVLSRSVARVPSVYLLQATTLLVGLAIRIL